MKIFLALMLSILMVGCGGVAVHGQPHKSCELPQESGSSGSGGRLYSSTTYKCVWVEPWRNASCEERVSQRSSWGKNYTNVSTNTDRTCSYILPDGRRCTERTNIQFTRNGNGISMGSPNRSSSYSCR